MKKIVFDNSIHLGQFCITDEKMRISAKNSQVMISQKHDAVCVGIESFNENTFSDHIIWGIAREPQDIFYKFMDIYHSVKNVDRIALNTEDARRALQISEELTINISNALTCAIAVRTQADEIHSFYSEFQKKTVEQFLAYHGISLTNPQHKNESTFLEENLEKCYSDALETFKKYSIDLRSKFHV